MLSLGPDYDPYQGEISGVKREPSESMLAPQCPRLWTCVVPLCLRPPIKEKSEYVYVSDPPEIAPWLGHGILCLVSCVCVMFVSPTPQKPLRGLDTVSCVWYLVCVLSLCLRLPRNRYLAWTRYLVWYVCVLSLCLRLPRYRYLAWTRYLVWSVCVWSLVCIVLCL
jgi:hypothetical protein